MSESGIPEKADSASAAAVAGEGSAPISDAYANYVVGVLFVVMMLNLMDRSILAIVLEPIKEELGVSDTALGLLSGFAFAIFYSAAGIPIARWADRGVRRSIIALGLVAWSGMTALSGLAQNFAQLVLANAASTGQPVLCAERAEEKDSSKSEDSQTTSGPRSVAEQTL